MAERKEQKSRRRARSNAKRRKVKDDDANFKRVNYDYNGKEVRVRKYVYQAELLYGVREDFQAQSTKYGIQMTEILFRNTMLTMKEISWLLDTPYETVRDHIKKYAKVRREDKRADKKPELKGKMNAEFLRHLAKYGVFHSIKIGNMSEKDINDLQKGMTAKGILMYQAETGGVVSESLAKSYAKHFEALGKGFDVLKDSVGMLNTKDRKQFEMQEKVHKLKADQFEMDKKGRNVAVQIIEEYSDTGTLSDNDLIFIVKNFLSSLGHDGSDVNKMTKQAIATIHYKKGMIDEDEYNRVLNNKSAVKDVEFENVVLS